ncbi:MAG: 50S ribosomal protein L11 methyltransferase [Bacteroidales bacterium]|nr:50S ribosomal protein L11 methyltransferase [Bacteroidales bacterium]
MILKLQSVNYIELNCTINPIEPFRDLLVAELAEIGFESFVETDNGLQAYIIEADFDESKIMSLNVFDLPLCSIEYSFKPIVEQNWNAVWESNYEAVLIADQCYVRAPFHEAIPEVKYDIVIEPKMSFGTAHHPTTSLMTEFVLELDLDNKSFLDMGCGTGLLAILAAKRGAKPVSAIDIDEWAYENSIENCERNQVEYIDVLKGGAEVIEGSFDIILANINRNILLNDMHHYTDHITAKGTLILSGFYEHDLAMIQEKAEGLGYEYQNHKIKNNWVAAKFCLK